MRLTSMLSVVLFKILYHSNKICDQGWNFGHGDLKKKKKIKEKSIAIIHKRILLFFLKYPIFYNQAKTGL